MGTEPFAPPYPIGMRSDHLPLVHFSALLCVQTPLVVQARGERRTSRIHSVARKRLRLHAAGLFLWRARSAVLLVTVSSTAAFAAYGDQSAFLALVCCMWRSHALGCVVGGSESSLPTLVGVCARRCPEAVGAPTCPTEAHFAFAMRRKAIICLCIR